MSEIVVGPGPDDYGFDKSHHVCGRCGHAGLWHAHFSSYGSPMMSRWHHCEYPNCDCEGFTDEETEDAERVGTGAAPREETES